VETLLDSTLPFLPVSLWEDAHAGIEAAVLRTTRWPSWSTIRTVEYRAF
jgi:hypothetical protein